LLPNIKSEDHVIGVAVAPLKVFLLLAAFLSIELTIIAVLILEIVAVSAVFIAIPGVVVAAVSIAVAPFVVVSVVRSRYDRSDQSGAQCERGQNQESMHVIYPQTAEGHFAGRSEV
jgi:membrane protein implicated in regulation of membrane protease activity